MCQSSEGVQTISQSVGKMLHSHAPNLKVHCRVLAGSFQPRVPRVRKSSGTFSKGSFTEIVRRCPPGCHAASVATEEASSGDNAKIVEPPFRVGHGFDLHRLAEGYPLIIGGIDIPHTKGCEAHSDGDVLLHCVVDAILGALSLPDIGQLFPDTDPKWKGASSDIFIREAFRLMKDRGYSIGNLDCTLIAQKPKLSPHKENIRQNLCDLLEAHPSVVNVKAKTHEKVDSIGEERSIACHTVVMLIKE